MKNKILKSLLSKYKRTSLGLGMYQNELHELVEEKEVNSALRSLLKEGKIEFRTGVIGTLYKVSKKYLNSIEND